MLLGTAGTHAVLPIAGHIADGKRDKSSEEDAHRAPEQRKLTLEDAACVPSGRNDEVRS